MMRVFITIAIIFISKLSSGQNLEVQKGIIDEEVKRISNLNQGEPSIFTIQALKKVLHYVCYEYIEDSKSFVRISRQFSHQNDTIQQTFFVKDGNLLYAEETITTYFTNKNHTDSIIWSGNFYFSKGKLIDHVTLGHGKSEMETWNPEHDMLSALNESKKDIIRYKKRK